MVEEEGGFYLAAGCSFSIMITYVALRASSIITIIISFIITTSMTTVIIGEEEKRD